ncbi:hypothetical protein DSM3645_08256 [Blastopirellula marina DSM 3645]|uniref:Uncharacterized protein n=1 Tax=Blastopirellula marina DSM 3645 TaxID=314230 RepID=A4A110_9BACT|nr:hypothetical protein DSM3645_08256 [Blastopirellula marina DSM 3645]
MVVNDRWASFEAVLSLDAVRFFFAWANF